LEEDIGEYEDDEMFLVLFLVFLIMIVVVVMLIVIIRKVIFPAISKTFRQCINIMQRRSSQDELLIELDENWQIQKERIDQLYAIGKGNFGEVFKGTLKPKSDEENQQIETVAIKTLKLEKFNETSDIEFIAQRVELEKGFIEEARRMTKLNTHHIVKLKGFWLKDKPFLVVMEFMELGDLKSLLVKHRNQPVQAATSSNVVSFVKFLECNSTT
jgi:Protein tyrosine and serine/threonine kinase